MGKQHITIHDLAKILKLNASTVSRALNDHPKISTETKKLVQQLASEMNYQPNALASSLRKGSAHTVGLVLPRVNRNFFASAIEGIEAVLNKAGYHLIITQSNERVEKEKICINSLISSRVDGIIISISWETIDLSHLIAAQNKKVPLIFFDRIPRDFEASKVMLNDFQGAYQATEYLINNGNKRIAFLGGPLHLQIYSERFRGYKTALEDYNYPVDLSYVIENCLTQESGVEAAAHLLSLAKKPDAIFSSSDYSALGALVYCKENGLKIPEDISIFGFANEPFTKLVDPPLSSIEQFPYKMGETAAQLFLDEIKNKGSKHQTIEIIPEIRVRQSVLSR
jgi:LacI family transcriptional regulator